MNCPFENYHESYNIDCINVYELELFEETPLEDLPSTDHDVQQFLTFGFENKFRTATINARNFIPYKVSPAITPLDIPESTLCDPNANCRDRLHLHTSA